MRLSAQRHGCAVTKEVEQRIRRICGDVRGDVFSAGPKNGVTLSARMKAWATPGASIAVIDGFEEAWARGFGVRTAGTRGRVIASTRFQAASLSKPVFALAVLRLVQDGRLDLDADVNGYLRSWRVPANDGWQPRITLRQLLSHSAGVTVDGFRGYSSSEPRPTLKQVLRGVAPANNSSVLVDVLPGIQRRYSGGGTTIAQQVVVDVMRRPFDELMDELVLTPLGMAHSTFAQPLLRALAKEAATAHPWNGKPLRGRWHIYPEQAAAGLWTTAGDLCRLGGGLMRALRDKCAFLGIDPGLLREMLKPQLPGVATGSDFASLGWSCSGTDETFCLSHSGWNEGFVALISLLPSSGKGAVILLNSNQGAPLRQEIRASIAREYGWPAEFAMQPIQTPAGLDYCGGYRDEHGREYRIAEKAGQMVLRHGDQPDVPLIAFSKTIFGTHSLELRIEFQQVESDRPQSLVLTLAGHRNVLRRSR